MERLNTHSLGYLTDNKFMFSVRNSTEDKYLIYAMQDTLLYGQADPFHTEKTNLHQSFKV